MRESDRDAVKEMMSVFYASEAVATNGSEEIFESDISECVSDSPYAEGYIFEENSNILGYAMLAKSFSTEYGKKCIWIEDIYIKDEFRGMGIGSRFFDYLKESYPTALLRLEVEEENERAVKVYQKNGFDFMPYLEMKK
jgi:ribosomal protein S18 acetylase RimI-like enzyme